LIEVAVHGFPVVISYTVVTDSQ